MQRRPFALSMMLVVATVAAGLTLRLVGLGLPAAAVKYGGSVLWALMVYWIVSTIRPRWPLAHGVLASGAIAFGVELFKLYHAPMLDVFRLTLTGKLLLGRVFSLADLLAYIVAVIIGGLLDRIIRATA